MLLTYKYISSCTKLVVTQIGVTFIYQDCLTKQASIVLVRLHRDEGLFAQNDGA